MNETSASLQIKTNYCQSVTYKFILDVLFQVILRVLQEHATIKTNAVQLINIFVVRKTRVLWEMRPQCTRAHISFEHTAI